MTFLRRLLQADTLQKRLVFSLLPLVILPIIVFSVAFYVRQTEDQLAIISEREEGRLTATRNLLQVELQILDDDISVLASIPNTERLARALLTGDESGVVVARTQLAQDFAALSRERDFYKQVRFLDVNGNEVVRVDRENGEAVVVPQQQLQNKADRPYFAGTINLPQGAVFVSPLNLNREGTPPQIELVDGEPVPVLRYGKPVYVENPQTGQRQIAGVVVTNVLAQRILDDLAPDIGETFLINSEGYYLYNSLNPNLTFGFEAGIQDIPELDRPTAEQMTFENFYGADTSDILQAANFAEQTRTADNSFLLNYLRVSPPGVTAEYYWVLATARDTSILTATIQQVAVTVIAIAVVFIVLAVIVIGIVSQYIARPIRAVSERAQRIAQGQFDTTTENTDLLRRNDELGNLSRSFQQMSAQLRELFQNLEARVEARTADLRTSAEIAAAANQVRQMEDLLSLTTNLLRDRFDFYYVQIYLIGDEGKFAVLREGTGYVGRRLLAQNWKLPLDGRSLVAEVIRTGNYSVVQDTATDPNFLPNELLPDTRAELTVPLSADTDIIGALDIQHNVPHIFTDDTRQLLQALADQLAVTFQNLRLLQGAERRARELTTVAEVSLEASSTLDIETLLKSVTRLTRDNFNLYHAHVYLLNDTRDVLELAAGSGEVGTILVENKHSIRFNEEHSLVAQAARNAQPVLVNDVGTAPDYLPNPLLPDTKSELAVPMIVTGEVIGVLDVQSDTANRFTQEDVTVQSTLASQIAVSINNARTFDAVIRAQEVLAENEARLSAITANYPNGAIVMYDQEMRYLLVDGLGLEESGLNKAEMEGRTIYDVYDEQTAEIVRATYQRALDGEEIVQEIPFRNLVYRTVSLPVRDESGEIIAAMTITQNITENKQQDYERELQLDVANALNQADNPQALLEAVLPHAQSQGLVAANLFYIDSHQDGNPRDLFVVANWRASEDTAQTPLGTLFEVDEYEAVQAWLAQKSQPTLHGDIANDPTVDEAARAVYAQFGTEASVVLPLSVAERWVGLILLNWSHPVAFTEADKRIYASIMRLATPTIDAARAAEATRQARERAELLARVNSALSQATNEQNILSALKPAIGSHDVTLVGLSYFNTPEGERKPVSVDIVAVQNGDGNVISLATFPETHLPIDAYPVLDLLIDQPDSVFVSENIYEDERILQGDTLEFLQASNAGAVVLIPLHTSDVLLGTISISWAKPQTIPQALIDVVSAIQPPASAVIASRRAYLAQQAGRNRADTLSTINQELSSAQNGYDILEAVATFAERFGPDNLSLAFYELDADGQPQSVRAVAAWANGQPDLDFPLLNKSLPLAAVPTIPLMLEAPNDVLIIEDGTNDPRINEQMQSLMQQAGAVSFIGLPLQAAGVWQGSLSVAWRDVRTPSEDEIYIFTRLIQSLSATVANLRANEQTERRARELEAVAQVSTATAVQLNLDELLFAVADLTKERFGRYHAHIYLMDEQNENLVLAAGAGEIGRQMVQTHHTIALDQNSLVARAAREREGIVIQNTQHEPGFLPNPLLPDTKSELALPILYGDQLLGVLDIQDDQPNQFDALEVQVKTTLANQVAVAIQNARAFERVQQQSAIVTTSQDFIGIADMNTSVEYVNPTGLAMTRYTAEEITGQSFAVWYTPETMARIQNELVPQVMEHGNWRGELQMLRKDGYAIPVDQTIFIIRDEAGNPRNIATIAQDITERKRAEEEQQALLASAQLLNDARTPDDMLAAIGNYAVSKGANVAYLFYLEDNSPEIATSRAVWALQGAAPIPAGVRITAADSALSSILNADANEPYFIEDSQNAEQIGAAASAELINYGVHALVDIPLRTQRGWIARVLVGWDAPQQFTNFDRRIYAAIQRQSVGAVDAMRAAEETRIAQETAQRRAAELETVARVSAAATTLLDVDELLQSVTELTKASFNLYHVHIYRLQENISNSDRSRLLLVAGAGEPGRRMKESGHSIPLAANSVVARAARERVGVIANDITQELDFLPNPLLPETRSELAVPMVVGDTLVGVLDVQADVYDRFTEEDVRLKTILADQIAVAVQNAEAYERERRAVEYLREVDRLKQEFLANMSHELRTPLNSIIGYSEVLLDGVDGDLSEDAVEDVDAIYTSGKHLLSIINEILDLAKIDAGQMELNIKTVQMTDILQDVTKSSQILVKDKPVTLQLIEDDPIPAVQVDPVRMNQIMLNLIGNAIKFTEEGAINIRYGLTETDATKDADESVYVSIEDTGIGMDENALSVIFERFRQADGSSTRRAGGTGLGLTITRQLLLMHGGDIEAASQVGVGSKFTFYLPLNGVRPKQLPQDVIPNLPQPETGD